jgi:hypothetical protein
MLDLQVREFIRGEEPTVPMEPKGNLARGIMAGLAILLVMVWGITLAVMVGTALTEAHRPAAMAAQDAANDGP